MQGPSLSASMLSLDALASHAADASRGGNEVPLTEETLEDFESLFISALLKEMRQTTDGEGLFAGDATDSYGGMFDMFMGKHLATGGGLGISEMLSATLQKGASGG